MKNKTQDLIELLEGRKEIGSKWVFCIKRKANGNIDKNWAIVIAKGFFQTKGLDFSETFALVAKLLSIKMLLALIAILDLEVHQMDVKNAFLNGCLEEDIYMMQPKGYKNSHRKGLVCKVKKAIYDLKQV